ncbi:phosphoglycerate kinase [Blastomyces silverae]|uniref:phosphoglycerate kinase n=1 Tax=Blastomyces silverae TaxID=2060906 RepID=A0A0H1BHF4_9EURO|nr:phosphoglycerate kinase [Blastomyces silverae]
MAKAKRNNVRIVFPVDHVIADKFAADANSQYKTDAEGIPDGWWGLDFGEKSVKLFEEAIGEAQTILWNGPPGVFEFEKFAGSTKAMLNACIAAVQKGKIYHAEDKLSHVSTGGGASLELLEGKDLPGVSALSSK